MGEVPGSIPGWAQFFLCTSEYFQRSFLINIDVSPLTLLNKFINLKSPSGVVGWSNFDHFLR